MLPGTEPSFCFYYSEPCITPCHEQNSTWSVRNIYRPHLEWASSCPGAASLSVYLSAPSTQSSTISGVSTADFETLPLTSRTTVYNSPIGTYEFSPTSPGAILAADQYGGANGSNYLSLGAQSGTSAPITINLSGNNNYFGFWFSAGDVNNGISFYSDNTLLAHYNTSTILTLLTPSSGTATAIDGTAYNRSAYYGNPNGTNQNTGEIYSYVDIIASGITFNKVVLDNSGTTGTGFESDNHSIRQRGGGPSQCRCLRHDDHGGAGAVRLRRAARWPALLPHGRSASDQNAFAGLKVLRIFHSESASRQATSLALVAVARRRDGPQGHAVRTVATATFQGITENALDISRALNLVRTRRSPLRILSG